MSKPEVVVYNDGYWRIVIIVGKKRFWCGAAFYSSKWYAIKVAKSIAAELGLDWRVES